MSKNAVGILAVLLLASCQPPEPPLAAGPTRAVEHAMGTSEVSLSPERVVVIDTTPLDAALALGIEPVGTIRYGSPPGYLGERASDIEVVGNYNQPNLETILRLEPDVILGAKSISEGLYPRLSRIAPTVFIEGAGYSWDWKNNFRLFAGALGEADQAEALLADYQQRLTDLKTSVAPAPETLTVSVLVTAPDGLVAHTLTSFSGSILQEVGFARNAAQAVDEQFFIRLSREDLAGADGDVVFLIHQPDWNSTPKEDFMRDPLWSKLGAVEREAVCEVAGEVWGSGRSLLAAHQVLTDIETCLTELEL